MSINIEKIQTDIDPIIDDKDAYLKIIATSNQVKPKIIPNEKEIPKMMPRYTATPFPPLNFNHNGKICPIKQINADK